MMLASASTAWPCGLIVLHENIALCSDLSVSFVYLRAPLTKPTNDASKSCKNVGQGPWRTNVLFNEWRSLIITPSSACFLCYILARPWLHALTASLTSLPFCAWTSERNRQNWQTNKRWLRPAAATEALLCGLADFHCQNLEKICNSFTKDRTTPQVCTLSVS